MTWPPGAALTSPQLTRDFLTAKLGTLEHEVFALILLDLCVADSYVELKLNAQQIEHCAGLCST